MSRTVPAPALYSARRAPNVRQLVVTAFSTA